MSYGPCPRCGQPRFYEYDLYDDGVAIPYWEKCKHCESEFKAKNQDHELIKLMVDKDSEDSDYEKYHKQNEG
jgi:transcriptional regulator NrdR family protein